MSTVSFKLPDLGEGLQEVEIISWHVNEGDFVVNEQPLISVETEKAVVDIPSPRSGKILRLHGKPGQTIPIGAILVDFSNDNGSKNEDAGSVVGNLSTGEEESGSKTLSSAPILGSASGASQQDIKAIPAARRLAQEQGIDLRTLQGTGPRGTIVTQDVLQALKNQTLQSEEKSDFTEKSPLEGYEPLMGARKSMAKLMTKSHQEVVPATVFDDVDIQSWYGSDTIMVRLIQGLIHACQAEPILNAWFEENSLKKHSHVHLGIAVDTPEGLLVPVMRNADTLSLEQIKTELDRLKNAAQARSLSPQDFKGATITLSNFGAIAGRHGAMVVSPPQVAIVGVGRVQDKVVLQEGTVSTHKTLPLSLTIDHRAVTGGEAARFLSKLIETLKR